MVDIGRLIELPAYFFQTAALPRRQRWHPERCLIKAVSEQLQRHPLQQQALLRVVQSRQRLPVPQGLVEVVRKPPKAGVRLPWQRQVVEQSRKSRWLAPGMAVQGQRQRLQRLIRRMGSVQ